MQANEKTPGHNLAVVIGRNTLWGLMSNGVQVATRLVSVPIVIDHLGLAGFGIWSVILTSAAYMRLGSAGTKSAFQKYVAEALGSHEYEAANTLLSTGTALALSLSIAGLVPVAIFSVSIAKAVGAPPEFLDTAAASITALAMIMGFVNAGSAYEAVLLGGQRIDLTRAFGVATAIAESIAIIMLLHFGFGLFAMTLVMAVSQLVYLLCCRTAARMALPQIRISRAAISRGAIRELVRFAGSYQLIGLLQVIYGAMVPVAVLRVFGANDAGVLAVANRLLSPIGLCQSSFLVPILSGGAMLFASKSKERMEALLVKSLKLTLLTTLIPMGILFVAGGDFIRAWIGQEDPRFPAVVGISSLGVLFSSIGQLAFVLYRATGRAVMDIAREVVRIVIVMGVAMMAPRLGFYGVIGGVVLAELAGMILIIVGVGSTFRGFAFSPLFQDILRVTAATLAMMAVGALVAQVSLPSFASVRAMAALKCAAASIAMALALYPTLLLTGSVSSLEVRSIINVFRRRTATS